MNKLERLKNVVVIVDEHTAASNIISQFERLGFENNIDVGVEPGEAIGIWYDKICAGKHPQYSTIFVTHEIITYGELVDLVDDYLNDLNKKEEDPFVMVDRFFAWFEPGRSESSRKNFIDRFKKECGYDKTVHTPSLDELIELYANENGIGVDQVKVGDK